MVAVAARGELEDDFAGARRRFRLRLAELEEIEAATGRGIFAIFDRAFAGAWSLGEVRAVLVSGLKGAGMAPDEARDLVAGALTPELLLEAGVIARAVLGVALAPDLAGEGEAPGSKKN